MSGKVTVFTFFPIVTFFLLLLAGCGNSSTSPGPHLRRDGKVPYYLNTEANGPTEIAVKSAFRNWEGYTHFKFVYMGRRRAGLRRDGKNTVSFLLRWPAEVPAGKTAYCMNWYDRRGNIVESDIIFNMELARFTTLETRTPESYYIEGVLAHEIGHMIGLGYIQDEGSLMKSFSTVEESYFMGRIDEKSLSEYRKIYADLIRPETSW